jgi:hypothetical protein
MTIAHVATVLVLIPILRLQHSPGGGALPRVTWLIIGATQFCIIAMMQKVRPKQLGDHKDPLNVCHLLKYVLGEQRRSRRRALRRTRRARLPHLAWECEQVLLGAVGAPDASEAVLEESAVEVAQVLLVDEAAPVTVPPLEALLPLPTHLAEVRIE